MSTAINLDKHLALTLVILAAIPFDQILQLNIGFAIFSITDALLIYLLIIVLWIAKKRGCTKQGLRLAVTSLSIFSLYIVISPLSNQISFGDAIRQARFFFPFISAVIILSTKYYGDSEIILHRIALAVGFSACFSIFMHFFLRDYVGKLLVANEDAVAIVTEGGRMYWMRSTLSFFVVAALFIYKNNKLLSYLLTVIVFFAILLTQSRTLAVAIFAFYLICQISLSRKIIRPLGYLAFSISFVILIFITTADDTMKNLFFTRFFGNGDISSEYERAFLINRVLNYEQYFNIFMNSFPLGQGLGKPLLITFTGDKIYTTDISFLSFLLPFGLFGIFLLLWYLKIVHDNLQKLNSQQNSHKRYKIFFYMVIVTLPLSLNLDIYSRNIFVIYLAYFSVLNFQKNRGAVTTQKLKKFKYD